MKSLPEYQELVHISVHKCRASYRIFSWEGGGGGWGELFLLPAEERVWLFATYSNAMRVRLHFTPLLDNDNFIGEWQVFKRALKQDTILFMETNKLLLEGSHESSGHSIVILMSRPRFWSVMLLCVCVLMSFIYMYVAKISFN